MNALTWYVMLLTVIWLRSKTSAVFHLNIAMARSEPELGKQILRRSHHTDIWLKYCQPYSYGRRVLLPCLLSDSLRILD